MLPSIELLLQSRASWGGRTTIHGGLRPESAQLVSHTYITSTGTTAAVAAAVLVLLLLHTPD
jgi:hypothetical protein